MTKDITGLRFNMLVAIEPTEKRNKNGVVYWKCKCDCGNEAVVNGNSLRSGRTKSCGCLRDEHKRDFGKIARNINTKHFGCWYCGSDKHYAKGYCSNCYQKMRRGTLK